MPLNRYVPFEEGAALAQAFEASGVVDDILMWDQLAWFFPPSLWTPENSPMAEYQPDAHSFGDVFMLAGYLHRAAPKLGIVLSTDAVRRGPAEMMQSWLTLSEMTGGRAILQVGAGEAKQCKPFGYKRSQGLGRLEDLLSITNEWWEKKGGPIDREGNYWTMKNAYIGAQMSHKPNLWALGGGPRLLDIATSHADGMAYVTPHAWDTPERAAEEISQLKEQIEAKGRDPEKFQFGIWVSALLHEDPDVITQAIANPLMRWMSAVWGRMNQAEWGKIGIKAAMPDDYHYAMKLLPIDVTAEEAQEVIARVSPEQQRLSWVHGTPQEVGAKLRDFAEAGVTWISVADVLPMTFPPDDAAKALDRTLEVCSIIKGRDRAAVGATPSTLP
jgi:phthiodiolone/phenolphthiodiolone dimycocerosates ketoreductase